MIFLNVLLPIFLVGGVGYALGRLTRFEPEPLTRLVFYVLGPALIFQSLYTNAVSGGEISRTVLFVVLLHVILLGAGLLGPRVLGWDRERQAATSLCLSFNNAGTYGLPVLLFAFGERGFALGIIYMVAHIALQTTLGVGVASWKKGMSLATLSLNVLKVPWFYALGLALVLRATAVALPTPLARPIDLLAQAAIPMQLVLLGIEFSRVRLEKVLRQAAPIALTKLILPPLLAWGLTALLGIHGLLRAVLIVEGSTPAAINSLLLALQYDRRPDLVAAVVLLTTAGSVLTIGLLLVFLA